MTDPLVDAAARVYRARPEEFVDVRKAEAAALAPSAPQAAALIRSLPKPVRAAWAVNVLVARMPERLAQLLDLGEALRRAHVQPDAERLRLLARERRVLVHAIERELGALCTELGVPLSASALDQVNQTLAAVLAEEAAERAVITGRLTKPLGPGVDPVAATALADAPGRRPRGRRPGAVVVPVPELAPDEVPGPRPGRAAQRGRHEAEIRAARRRVDRLQAALDRIESELAGRAGSLASIRSEALQARRRWEELEREAAQVAREKERAEQSRRHAQEALDEAADLLASAEQSGRLTERDA
ncbi:hypothetical protein LQF12_07995 [Ruania suaedae]|uniref:hypothetical protein n=1 Tax=Ruania suaedae TaxID=2897774 RepID=UPI001E29B320|nr:hypothetical protein [Ruania suaedae]UFU04498.1 hypothetical protein LQF12_07995 [Ruania suaedae]